MNNHYLKYFSSEIIENFSRIYPNALEILESLLYPTSRYTLRVNTLKTNADEVINLLKEESYKFDKYIINGDSETEIIYHKMDTKRQNIEILDKKIYVDRFTGESICQGANLYMPGLKKCNKFHKDNQLTVLTKINSDDIPVANIKACVSSKDLFEMKRGIVGKNIHSLFKGLSIQDLDVFKRGLVYDQSLPAILTSKILDPRPEEFVIDMCAAPGGKTTHIAQLMDNKGTILALDRSDKKIEKIKRNCERLGIRNIILKKMDSTKITGYSADKILIDPPCSALGIRPKLAITAKNDDILNFAQYQKKFINAAMKNIKHGGVLVYGTCTLTLEENEMNIQYMLENFNCQLVKQPIFIGKPGFIVSNNTKMELTQRFSPIENQSPGFFIAKLQVFES